jgi:nicotinate-nucleotide--dimethylbenzimidazole phosphoribosyltransferase
MTNPDPAQAQPGEPMPQPDIDAFYRLAAARRDMRNGFRPDPVSDEVLTRVLAAAHQAPSVGLSQPWDFIIVRDREVRERVQALARRQRELFAASLPGARAVRFGDLKIEAILETPLNIVVTCDPTRGGRHVLGRHSQPQVAAYSSVCAVQNLWLAARAEGLGVGWVSFFDERELAATLGLPGHLEIVAYLCVGHVAEFPPPPELATSG